MTIAIEPDRASNADHTSNVGHALNVDHERMADPDAKADADVDATIGQPADAHGAPVWLRGHDRHGARAALGPWAWDWHSWRSHEARARSSNGAPPR